MRFLSLLCFCCSFLLLEISIYAQSPDSSDVSYYLNDGGISGSKNIVKLNLASLITGDLSVGFERKLSKTFTLEGGAGLLLPYYVPEAFGLFQDKNEIVDPRGGYSYYIQPKIYYSKRAFDFAYIGLQYRKRHYFLAQDLEIDYTDFSFNGGMQFFVGKRLLIDYYLGIGFRFKKYSGTGFQDTDDTDMGIVMPLAVKLGYSF